GMHQMALFSICGLTFSWLTIICWFPFLVSPDTLKRKLGLQWYKRSIFLWPIARRNKRTLVLLGVFAIFCIMGLSRLVANDDIRLLQMPNASLMEEQKKISSLLGMAAPAQFYLVRGETPELLLQREEALRAKLDVLVEEKTLLGYQALSSWVPSARTQKANQALISEKLLDGNGPLQVIQNQIGANRQWHASIRENMLKWTGLLEINRFFEIPGAESLRYLWLETENKQFASMVTLKGVSMDNLQVLAAAADKLDGVQWVDKVDEISSVLGYYREYMGWVILFSYGVTFVFLYWRYKRDTWRVMLPTTLASLATLAFFGLIGIKLQLFHMLAFMLILGIGVDYSIFLQENVTQNLQSVWLEIGVSVTSTLLGFGLLSLSSSPALHSFGLTLLIALSLIWILVPCFRKDELPEPELICH
ncbi:MAG: MMPL family transporter, partial [Betaproteobacteria bacterium]|nr:MMPL family transporter [Betaproteobacteria bacterium]